MDTLLYRACRILELWNGLALASSLVQVKDLRKFQGVWEDS